MALATFVLAMISGTIVPRPLLSAAAQEAQGVTIYIASSAIHTDIIIPADADSKAEFAFLGEALPLDDPNVKWVMFGWGGRSFYIETPTLSEIKMGPLLRGLTVDRSTMHVEVLGELGTDSPALLAMQISKDGYARLRDELLANFQTDAEGLPLIIEGAGYGKHDRFYEAKGSFNALSGCNTWTARMLRVAGVRTGLWNLTPQSLRLSLNLYN
ncbi:MAG: TIGR02117 family protein [Rhizobiaceae bacterium]